MTSCDVSTCPLPARYATRHRPGGRMFLYCDEHHTPVRWVKQGKGDDARWVQLPAWPDAETERLTDDDT